MKLKEIDMTNKEAAHILTMVLNSRYSIIPRGCGKVMMHLRIVQAFCKAIDLLEKTPDEKK